VRKLALLLLVGCTDLSLDPSPKLIHALKAAVLAQ